MLSASTFYIAAVNVRNQILAPRFIICLVFGLLLGVGFMTQFVSLFELTGIAFQYAEPLAVFLSHHAVRVAIPAIVAFMVSDAPFIYENVPYIVFRTGRSNWMVTNSISILYMCLMFIGFVSLVSIIASIPFAYVDDDWSPIMLQALESPYDTPIELSASILYVIGILSPLSICIVQFGLLALYSMCISGVMLIVNSSRGTSVGFPIAMAFHGLMIVLYLDRHPVGILLSLFTYADLGAIYSDNILSTKLSYGILLLFVIMLYSVAVRLVKRMDV